MYTQRSTQLHRFQKSLAGNAPLRQYLAMGLVVLLGVLAALYVLFLATTTMHIAERKSIKSEIRVAHSVIADLETDFFAQANTIDLAYAYELGYVEVGQVAFKERIAPTESVAFNVE